MDNNQVHGSEQNDTLGLNQFVYNKKNETLVCSFLPDDLIIVLSSLANFAATGKVEIQISQNKPGFHVYDTVAHKNADILWHAWFDNLVDELNLNISSRESILSQILTGLLVLYTEDKEKYLKLATRPFRVSPLLQMSPGRSAPADIDILIAALMRSEKENKVLNPESQFYRIYYSD